MKRLSLVTLVVSLMTGCGGGGGGSGPPMITAVVVSGDSTVVLNGTRQLAATAMSGSTPVSSGVTFQWTSSDTTRATVSGTGLVSGVRLGSTSVTARAVLNGTPTSVASGGKSMRTRVGAIVITPGTPGFASLGDSVLASVEARDALNAAVPGLTFTWQSRASGVASVTARVNTAQADLVAVANGTTKVVVTTDGVSDSVTATVQQIATTLAISPDTVTFGRLDSILSPIVTATDARGNAITSSAINWSTQSATIASVNTGSGAIQSKGEGQTRVIGTSGAFADTVRIGVALVYGSVRVASGGGLPAPIDTAFITRLNGTLQLGVIVRDVGNTVVPSPQVTWSLKHNNVGTIDAAGLINGNSSTGRDTVVVVARTVRDSVPLIVRQDVATVVISPRPPTQDLNFVGDTLRFSAQARDAGGAAIPGRTPVFSTSRQIISISGGGLATADTATSSVGIVVRIRVDIDGHKDSTDLRTKQVPASAALSPGSLPTLHAVTRTTIASCVVKDSGNTTIPNHLCTWTAVTPGVVSFNPTTGASTTITALSSGTTTINATAAPSIFAPNFIEVDQVAASMSLFPVNFGTPDVQMTVSQSAPFWVVVQDSAGVVDPRSRSDITWSVSAGTSASVSAGTDVTNTVTTTASPGSVTIAAAIGGGPSASRGVAVVATGVKFSGAGGVQSVFTASCDNCHAGTGAPEGLRLELGQSYGDIVDVPSGESPLTRARPFRPDSSYLVHKIQGTQTTVGGSGVRMPFGCSGGGCLPNATINLIRNWILQGALNN
jgi:hypothetical protein